MSKKHKHRWLLAEMVADPWDGAKDSYHLTCSVIGCGLEEVVDPWKFYALGKAVEIAKDWRPTRFYPTKESPGTGAPICATCGITVDLDWVEKDGLRAPRLRCGGNGATSAFPEESRCVGWSHTGTYGIWKPVPEVAA